MSTTISSSPAYSRFPLNSQTRSFKTTTRHRGNVGEDQRQKARTRSLFPLKLFSDMVRMEDVAAPTELAKHVVLVVICGENILVVVARINQKIHQANILVVVARINVAVSEQI
ncbi:hypothetical protein L1987_09723 [Smallanthus sonchifolius]|uniref:Uncharacterized protein n=1 Tax=Smallanthus sonchifolius TaxID=185202 RepID=A0ACB9JQ52_9ASTR|nr:hypothetical protein L1987_09723 [Smallanthus sonchifolius]